MHTNRSDMIVLLPCVGMAGSGKTTLMQRLNAHLHAQKRPGYVLNLDPAVTDTPYEPNIDIRDTVGAEREEWCPGLKPTPWAGVRYCAWHKWQLIIGTSAGAQQGLSCQSVLGLARASSANQTPASH